MTTRWRFYDRATGVIKTRLFTGARDTAQVNAPEGWGVIPAGDIDPLCQRVDVDAPPPVPTPAEWFPPVVDYQPPKPADTADAIYAWDAATRRWVAAPTLEAIKRSARQLMAQQWEAARRAGVSIGGKLAPTDAPSWTRYLAIKQMAADGGWVDVPIPLADGSFELLTQAKAAALWAALKDTERTLLARLRSRVEAINAAATAAEVEAVQW